MALNTSRDTVTKLDRVYNDKVFVHSTHCTCSRLATQFLTCFFFQMRKDTSVRDVGRYSRINTTETSTLSIQNALTKEIESSRATYVQGIPNLYEMIRNGNEAPETHF